MIPSISLQQIIDANFDETRMTIESMRLVANARNEDCKLARMHFIYTTRIVLGEFAGSNAMAAFLNERKIIKIRQMYEHAIVMFEHDHKFRSAQMRILQSLGLSFKWSGARLDVWKE